MKKIRVLLADDHPVVRAGVRAFLESEPDMVVVGEASIGCQAVAMAQDLRPDVVIMDVSMPNMNGIEATKLIRTESPSIQVLAVTAHDSPEYFFELMKAEAVGYVLKEATPSVMRI